MHHIAILVEKELPFHETRYLMREIAEIWQEQGLRVSVLNGISNHVDADLVIMHVDMTVVPDNYLAFIRKFPVAINGSVTDISKRRISSNIVRRNDGYQGQVIVKTNNNCKGGRDSEISSRGPLMKKIANSVRCRLPWSWRSKLSNYPIFELPSRIPRAVWFNSSLVVEKFLPERIDGLYSLRTWFFLGDKELNLILYSDQPIVKSNNMLRYEKVAEVPEELRQMRRDMNFDFGRFDYAIINDRVILYDANRTPTLGSFTKEELLPTIHLFAEEIRAFL